MRAMSTQQIYPSTNHYPQVGNTKANFTNISEIPDTYKQRFKMKQQ